MPIQIEPPQIECARCYKLTGADYTTIARSRRVDGKVVSAEVRNVCPACSVALELTLRNSDDGGELSEWGSERPQFSPEFIRVIQPADPCRCPACVDGSNERCDRERP